MDPYLHTARVEKGAIKVLSNRKNCLDLKPSIENITNRIVDTEQLLRENFYNPKMMRSYSLKNIVKALPKHRFIVLKIMKLAVVVVL